MEPALFEVTDHFYIRGRGVVVSGHPRNGRFRKGMLVHTGDDPPVLIVTGLDIGHTVKRRAIFGVVFEERRDIYGVWFGDAPSLEFVQKVFPVGSVLRGEEASPADR
jgi:hypothetical protein